MNRPVLFVCFLAFLIALVLVALFPSCASALTPAQRSARATVVAEAHKAGYGPINTAALVWLAKRESNYHTASRSRGGHYLGLFQLHNTMCEGKPWRDAGWNTRRAIVYIERRYHSPARAKRFWLRHGWY